MLDSQELIQLELIFDMTNQALAIAVNREVVPRAKWREHRFVSGDKVDVVRAIGGG